MIGCVAQQEGERIFDKAPYVSIVAGSASATGTCRGCWRGWSGGSRGLPDLDDKKTTETFETPFVARTNQHRGYITIIEGCDKFCAYCVVPYTRGNERSRSAASVMEEARRMVDAGYTEIQFLGQNVNSYRDPSGAMTFAELLQAVGTLQGDPAGAVYDESSAGLYEGHRGGDRCDAYALRPCASAGAVGVDAGAAGDGAGVYAGVVPGADFVDQGGAAGYFDYERHHCGISGGDGGGVDGDGDAAG